jgi:hypothetical protein
LKRVREGGDLKASSRDTRSSEAVQALPMSRDSYCGKESGTSNERGLYCLGVGLEDSSIHLDQRACLSEEPDLMEVTAVE